MSHLVLFDIDMTLVRLNAVGRRAMTAALLELVGIEDGLAGIDFAGRTDRWILKQALEGKHVPEDFERFLLEFGTPYLQALEAQLPALGGEVLAGAVPLLDALVARGDVRLGVQTGNLREAAWFKLKAFDLDRYFVDGGFADDAEERDALVATAIARLGGAVEGHRVVVVGDSLYDVTAALANEAVAVGVATGRTSIADLEAAGAHLALRDLTEAEALLSLL
ncbi:MAG: HAD family hydrolase [Dehalococcoidia bacterium]